MTRLFGSTHHRVIAERRAGRAICWSGVGTLSNTNPLGGEVRG